MLISKLEPLKLAPFLSSSANFSQSEIDKVNAAPSRSGRVINLLSFIESGDSEVVKDFISALTDAGFSDLAKLLDPIYFHHKASKSTSIKNLTFQLLFIFLLTKTYIHVHVSTVFSNLILGSDLQSLS